MDTLHSKLGNQVVHLLKSQAFGEDVGALICGCHMVSLQDALFKVVLNVELVNVHMFHPVMMHRIMSQTNG